MSDEWQFDLRDNGRLFQFQPVDGAFGRRAGLTIFEGETSDDYEPVIGADFSIADFTEFADRCTRLAAHLRGEL